MGTRERILAIRLMDKISTNPTAAEKLGIVAANHQDVQSVEELK